MAPEISIVIPSYNQPPDFVSDCFKSICDQKDADYEIIFVDGGSRPETLAAAEVYRERCVHFISEPDNGQADAINKGLRLAAGNLVAWLNTDDFYLPGAFRRMADAAAKNPGAPFYMGIGYRTDITGVERREFYPKNFQFNRKAYAFGLNFVLQPATFINRAVFEKTGGRLDENLHYVLDSELWFRLLEHGDPCWVPFPVACSREYTATKTATGAWKRFNEIQGLAERYTGCELTPGVLAELCRLLHESMADEKIKQLFPAGSEKKVIDLWGGAAGGLRSLSGRDDGFPVKL